MTAGRSSKYETHVKPKLDRIKKMRQSGYREEDIYKYCGVSHEAFARYKRNYVELVEALKIGTDDLILDLEDTLFKKALGGDTTCLLFSLKNLAPKRWADKQEISYEMNDTLQQSMKEILKEARNESGN